MSRFVFLGLLWGVLSASHPLSAQDVVTLLGTGEAGWDGDGGLARKARCQQPFGLVVGPDQAIYVCETASHVIRRIDPVTQIVTTVAGTGGVAGYAGDGGPASAALLNEPYEIRFDRHGHMYFVEMKGCVVRRVDARSGVISTVAGDGNPGFGGDGGPATKAQLKQPHSIVLDHDGVIYLCDIGNHRIRRVDPESGLIETFAGTGATGATLDGAGISGTPLNGPRALDFDPSGALLLTLREGNAVFRIDTKTLTYHHLAGTGISGYSGDGGVARTAQVAGPKGIALGPGGDIYLADTESHTIRVIRSKSGIIETLVGDGIQGDGPDGVPRSCRLARPHGVFVDTVGNVYIGDSSNHRVRLYRPAR